MASVVPHVARIPGAEPCITEAVSPPTAVAATLAVMCPATCARWHHVDEWMAHGLPDIESKLRSLDVHSAWRLLPELQVGIVHVASEQHLDKVVALMSRMEAGRVGVSARFDDLRDTPQALHFAKVMLRGQSDRSSRVAVFDGSILATAAVSAPEAMVKSVGPRWTVVVTFPTGSASYCSRRFGCGRRTTHR